MTPSWVTVFLDLAEPDHERTQRFWSAVTGYAVSPVRGDAGEFTTLVPPDGDDILRVQRLARGRSRLHLDLHVPDPHAAADRAGLLGAHVVTHDERGFVVLASPAGITCCLVTHPAGARPAPARWGAHTSLVDQVCLDVAPSAYDAEVAFWEALTGFAASATRLPELRRVVGPATQPFRFLLQRLGEERPAGAHLDLAATDRAAEVERHVGLGAHVETVRPSWTVLRDPAGLAYCVTDRDPATGAVP